MRLVQFAPRPLMALIGTFTFVALITAAPAEAADVTFGIGYSRLELDGSEGPFDEEDGVRFDGRFTFAPGGEDLEQLRLGFGLSISGFEKRVDDDDAVIIIDDEVFFLDSDDVESLTLISPEVSLSWRQVVLGDEDNAFILEPGVAGTLIVGNYWVGDTTWFAVDEDIDEWDVTVGVRPFLRAGYQGQRLLIGAELAYLLGGSLDFTDDVGGDVSEFYAGFFVGGRW